jgi:hypothetical protein
LWECGEWRGIRDEKIYQRLYQVMISYIENREKQPNLACPQSTIFYPFRLVKESQLELPQGTRVKILDLPGLAYVGDRGNANVIKQCREALCIVTYNSAETDAHKVKSLLQEVVQQVKDLGGSPARMLFTLNRIDVFRADKNWPETENRFVEKAIRDIKNELTEQLKEYTEDILEDLPRNVQKWSRHDRNRVAEALWQESYAEEFQQHLKEHINQHFPQLVIPQAIERFNVAAGNAVGEWAVQTTTAILSSSEEHYQQECEKISQIRLLIERFLQISDTKLREPFERIDTKIKQVIAEQSEDDPVLYLESTILELKNVEPYNLLGEKLYPLYGWRRELGQGIKQVLEAVAKSLETGKVDLDSTNLKKANLLNVNLLGRNLNRLVNLGYTASVAKEGKIMEAKTDSEKNQLKQINEELNELAIHLNIVMEDVLKQISNQELNRMYQAVVELFNCYLSYIEEGANDIAPNIAIKFPESKFSKVDSQLTFNFRFEAGFPINKGTWQESVQVAREKRIWYTLWIAKKTVYDTKYETRSSDNAEIPSVENLLTGWIIQSKKGEAEIVNKIVTWLLEQIDCLKKNVDKIQNDIIDRYQTRLDKANQEITVDYEKQKNVWQPIQQKAQNLAEEFSSLEKVLKEEH